MLVQHVKPQLVWPPVLVGCAAVTSMPVDRAFVFITHGVYSFACENFGWVVVTMMQIVMSGEKAAVVLHLIVFAKL
jgi:hypothetical protein